MVRLHQIDELWRRLSVNRHEVIVGIPLEQFVECLSDVRFVLDQALRARVELTDLTLGAVIRDEPVVTESLSVLLLRQPNDLGRLPLKALQLSRSNCHMRAELKTCHNSSSREGCILALVARQVPNEN